MNAGAARILVVDDEHIVARELAENLAEFGYDVPATAASAAEALVLARSENPDLVLLDIRIGEQGDGVDVGAVLRAELGVPVVYITACSDSETFTRAQSTEPYAYITKPVKPSDLRSAVELALQRAARERRSKAQTSWLSTTLQSIADGVVCVDIDGRITFLNQAAEALTGCSFERGRGELHDDVLLLVEPDGNRHRESPLALALAQRATAVLPEGISLRASDGTEHAIEDSAAPIENDAGELLGAVMVFHDVSEQRRLRRQAEHNGRLAALGLLAAGVAHEVNNPLTFVVGNQQFIQKKLELLQSSLSTTAAATEHAALFKVLSEIKNALDEAVVGTERVRSIMGELGMLGRAPSNLRDLFELHAALDAALTTTLPQLSERARVVCEFGVSQRVRGDHTRLTQVFVNLLLNAANSIARGAPDSNEIRIVTAISARGGTQVEIRDTGCGIHPENLVRIFEPFFTTRSLEGGSGLGLSVSHGIISSFNGSIEVESRLGKGSVFRVLLPGAGPESSIPPPSTPRRLPARPRILAIDDEPIILNAIARLLSSDYSIDCVNSAAAALELLERGATYHLILCDLMMPRMTGMRLFSVLEQRFPEHAALTVFMTGAAFTPEAQEFLKATRRRVLEKPFTNTQLQAFLADGLVALRERNV